MSKNTGKAVSGWTDHELLICLLNLVNNDNIKLNYEEGVYPANRNANGFRQKINTLKRDMKTEIESYKSGGSADASPKKKAVDGTPKAKGGRKRKAASDDDDDNAPKKRGRPAKKTAVEEEEGESESPAPVKQEPEGEVTSSI
ncbi:hypothetical protein IQ06DRAFT_140014 [Phaeosphaeriaceae sp. SRC1lsM3a]|nr:hypothetical protein IQ06DRAFT_140014 [Stagonospora sp. SRC1lsM3a]